MYLNSTWDFEPMFWNLHGCRFWVRQAWHTVQNYRVGLQAHSSIILFFVPRLLFYIRNVFYLEKNILEKGILDSINWTWMDPLLIFMILQLNIYPCIFMTDIVSYLPYIRLFCYQWYSEPLKTISSNLLFDTLWSIYWLGTFHRVKCYEKGPLLILMHKLGYKYQQKICAINLI